MCVYRFLAIRSVFVTKSVSFAFHFHFADAVKRVTCTHTNIHVRFVYILYFYVSHFFFTQAFSVCLSDLIAISKWIVPASNGNTVEMAQFCTNQHINSPWSHFGERVRDECHWPFTEERKKRFIFVVTRSYFQHSSQHIVNLLVARSHSLFRFRTWKVKVFETFYQLAEELSARVSKRNWKGNEEDVKCVDVQ